MRRASSTAARLARAAALAALSALAFEACSTTDDASVTPPGGPAAIAFAGHGGQVFQCDKTIGVTLDLTFWTLRPAGECGTTPQCGTVRVTLIAADGSVIAENNAASEGVALEFPQLSAEAFTQVWSQLPSPTLRAELIDDAGRPFLGSDGGALSVEEPLSMLDQGTCAGELGAGAAGAGGAVSSAGGAGGAGASSGEGGAPGTLGGGGLAGASPEGGAGGVPNGAAGAPAI